MIRKSLVLMSLLVGIYASAYDFAAKNSDGKTIYYNKVSSNQVAVTYCNDGYTGEIVIPSVVNVTKSVLKYSTVSGTWTDISNSSAVDGAAYICKSPGSNGSTVLRITFSTSGSITFACTSNGEDGFDYLNIGNLDSSCTRTAYKETLKGSSGVTKYFTFTPGDSNEHYVEFCYSKDGSVDSNSDNATVYVSAMDQDSDDYAVVGIGKEAFYYCSNLTSVTIPESATSIEKWAFAGCEGLTSINIPESVNSISSEAFLVCGGLISFYGKYASDDHRCLIISGQLKAFAPNGISSYRIPNTVTSIGSAVFYGYNNLSSVTIPDTVTSIEDFAFGSCGITSITIGNSVNYIGRQAFSYSNIESIYIPNSTTTIASMAFTDCENLKSVIIGDSLTSIPDNTFVNCSSLSSVTIGKSVKSIGFQSFENCTSLNTIVIPESVIEILYDAFKGSGLYLNERNWENGVLYVGDCLIKAKDTLAGDYAIKENTRLIGDNAFNGCKNLTSITIPNGVECIPSYAFMDCHRLTSATIGNRVTKIRDYAFGYCKSLESITIPKTVTIINERAFKCCENLCSIICKIVNPKETYCDREIFESVDTDNCILYVPARSIDIYRTTYPWSRFKNINAIQNGQSEPTDVTGDGVVNVSDISSILDMILNPLFEDDFGDVNGDGNIDIRDVSDIIDRLIRGVEYNYSPNSGTLFLIGDPSGWREPSPKNFSALKDWRLYCISDGVFVGTFYIPARQARLRFYSNLTGWDGGDSWGCQEYDSDMSFNITDGQFTSDIVNGKGSFNFPDWNGGYMTITVDLNNKRVNIKEVNKPNPEYIIAEGASVQAKLIYTANDIYVGHEYFGVNEASFSIGTLGIAESDCTFPESPDGRFSARLIENGNPIRFSSWAGGVLEIRANLSTMTVDVKPIAQERSMELKPFWSTTEAIHVDKEGIDLIPVATVHLQKPLCTMVTYFIELKYGGDSRKFKGKSQDGVVFAYGRDLNQAFISLCGQTSEPEVLEMTITSETNIYPIKPSQDFTTQIKLITDDEKYFAYTPGYINSWDEENSLPLIGDRNFEKYSGLVVLDRGFRIKDKNSGKSYGYGGTEGTLSDASYSSSIPVESRGLYHVTANLKDLTYRLEEISSLGITGAFCSYGKGIDLEPSSDLLVWEGDIQLNDSELRIRGNHSWAFSLGGDASNLTINTYKSFTSPGPGDYHIRLDISKYPYRITFTPN